MAVTRAKAADIAKSRSRQAGLDTGCLLASSLAVFVGLTLVYNAKTFRFAEADELLRNKELLNLNYVSSHDELLPYLDAFSNLAERQFVARRVYEHIAGVDSASTRRRVLPNVGALAKIRVGEKEIDSTPQLDDLRKRLAVLREKEKTAQPESESLVYRLVRPLVSLFRKDHGAEREKTLGLLTSAQLARIKPSLVVRTGDAFKQSFWTHTFVYFAGFYLIHVFWLARKFKADGLLLPIVHLLTGVGLMVMLSLRDPLRDTTSFTDFSWGVALALALGMFPASLLDCQRSILKRLSFVPLLASFALATILLIFGSGPAGSDAKVNLGPFQPVEIIKILLVLFLAGYFADQWEVLRNLKERPTRLTRFLSHWNMPRLRYVIPVLVGMVASLMFFFLQKDLGPALVMSLVFLTMYGVARKRIPMVAVGMALMILGFYAGYKVGSPQTVVDRIQMWLSPWDNTVRGGDQLAQSLWGLATGASTGTGLGLGEPGIVPAAHTDLILSSVGEEMGFWGLLLIFALYAALIYRSLRIALRARGDYSFFLALGLSMIVGLQITLISGGILGLLPLTGVVNPFLSFGKTSMWANSFIIGILASISAKPREGRVNESFEKPVKLLSIGLGLLVAIIVFRIGYIQLYQSDGILIRGALAVQADGSRRYQYNPRLVEVARQIPRGTIYDRNGIPIATGSWDELQAHRQEYLNLGVNIDQACSRLERRHYPFGAMTYYLLGDYRTRKNWAATNTSFEERDSNVRLRGFDDHAKIEELPDTRTGELVRVRTLDYRELTPLLRNRYNPDDEEVQRILNRNRNVRMSIDIRLQLRLSAILENRIHRSETEKGSVVVLDPQTGDLLASVSYPWPGVTRSVESDDDDLSDNPDESQLDRARYGLYPPGSTFKMVTATAALRTSSQLSGETFECKRLPDGRVGNFVHGWSHPIHDDISDRYPHGTVNLERGFIASCNAYFAQLGVHIGPEALRQTAEMFGIVVARPNTAEKLRDALPQAAYGQGQVVASPFQMARVAATIANGGNMPYGRWVTDESNQRSRNAVPVLNRNLSDMLARFMRGVVTDGTGRRQLRGSPTPIAGKTGTAENQDGDSHSWFAGFAPYGQNAGNRIAFCVLIENGGYGGGAAAETAGEVVAATRELGMIR